jgi:hypothetical protein
MHLEDVLKRNLVCFVEDKNFNEFPYCVQKHDYDYSKFYLDNNIESKSYDRNKSGMSIKNGQFGLVLDRSEIISIKEELTMKIMLVIHY